ncbi:MAG: sterol desaturase family protein [bacterium]|nr:sterol desaturase family protein [bacterium]
MFTIGLLIGIVYASFFEWWLHKNVMHKPLGKFEYPFNAHAIIHHTTFKADHTYHLIRDSDKMTIPMKWWNGPVLTLVAQIPFLIASILFSNYWIVFGSTCAVAAYYCTYEYIHWCMHLPTKERKRLIERSWFFYRLNGHHLLHHRYMHKNFNVVLPLADLLLGTFLPRSKVCFAQATGPSVPDVQPLIRNEDLSSTLRS